MKLFRYIVPIVFLLLTTISLQAQEYRLLTFSNKEKINLKILTTKKYHIVFDIIKKKPIVKYEKETLFKDFFPYTPDGLICDVPFPITITHGTDTMCLFGLCSNIYNYHFKNFEFKKGNWFIKTKPWFQQKVVTGSEIFNPTMSIVKVHQREKIRHVNDKYESFDEKRFFEIDLADTNEVEMMSMDSSFSNKYYNTPRSYYDILEWQDYLLFDEDAKQYVEKIQKEYDYYGSGRRVPYIAPYYTKEEYEESIK